MYKNFTVKSCVCLHSTKSSRIINDLFKGQSIEKAKLLLISLNSKLKKTLQNLINSINCICLQKKINLNDALIKETYVEKSSSKFLAKTIRMHARKKCSINAPNRTKLVWVITY